MYRRSADIEGINATLAAWFPGLVTRIGLEPSREGREITAVRIRGGDRQRRRGVLLVGGIHARELLNPDVLVEMTMGLLGHYLGGSDWTIGARTWSAEIIRTIVEVLDVFMLPGANPDGREYVLDGYRLWRKNRAPLVGTTCVGVDLNRNFDLLWGIETQDDLGVIRTSRSPCNPDGVFVGPGAFSEPETQNVRRLLDDYPIARYVDVHSYSELILHPWGHAPNQTTDPSERFTLVDTSGWNKLPNDAPDYEEYIDPVDLERFVKVGSSAAEAIKDVRGRTYTVEQGRELYPTTGTSSDYAYSRHVADPGKRKVYGFTCETGPWAGNPVDSFQPEDPEASAIKEEATSGLLSIIASSICAFDLIGVDLFGEDAQVLSDMREIRDTRLVTTDAGRGWVRMLSRHQPELVRLAINDPELRREGARLIGHLGGLFREQREPTTEAVRRALNFLSRLQRATTSEELRRDLELVKGMTSRLARRTWSEIIDRLASEPPRE